LLAASVDGVRVTAFEPDDAARRRAEANIERNGFRAAVEIRAEAVGSAAATSSFSIGLGPENRLVRDGAASNGTRLRTVDIVALDEVVDGPVAVLKIDVEGEELAVLDGAERVLARDHPVVIVEANAPEALTERLASLGYRWVTYDPDTRRVADSPAPPAIGTNGIAVADMAALLDRLSAR
jgi:FkbM family methyltransferase